MAEESRAVVTEHQFLFLVEDIDQRISLLVYNLIRRISGIKIHSPKSLSYTITADVVLMANVSAHTYLHSIPLQCLPNSTSHRVRMIRPRILLSPARLRGLPLCLVLFTGVNSVLARVGLLVIQTLGKMVVS